MHVSNTFYFLLYIPQQRSINFISRSTIMAIFSLKSKHILIIPYPAQGHMLSLLDLVNNLCTHLNLTTTTITILITPKNLPTLTPLLNLYPCIKTLTLPFPSHSKIPSNVENTKDLPPNTPPSVMIDALYGLYDPLLSWFESNPSPPSTILSDFFLGWTEKLAAQVGARRIVFSPSGAFGLSIIYSLWKDMPEPDEDLTKEFCFHNIPKSPKYPWWQISPMYRSYKHLGPGPGPGRVTNPGSERLKEWFKANLESWGLVVNTFDDVEGEYLDYLRKLLGHNRVWAVGPLILKRLGAENGPGLDADMALFLNSCAADSVVYVAFGSQAVLSNDQMKALADGLEMSGAHFIWSVKVPTEEHVDGEYGCVPEGFEARVAGRGMVVRRWAPQAEILSHGAVGAFLTHCGWNSVTESIIAGVPMLAWPMGADQFTNATLVVDDLKVGVRVCEGASVIPDSDELSKVIRDSVSDDSWSNYRKRARELKEKAKQAVEEGGSSSRDMNELVKGMFEM